MNITFNLFGPSSPEPARPTPIGRNEAQHIKLSSFRKPWWNYWTECGGEGFLVVGGPKRKAEIMVPTLFPTRAVARSVAKYMTRSARIRINGTLVT
jgi:hypothetical protein